MVLQRQESDGFETTDPDSNPVIKKYNDRYVAYDYAQNTRSMGDLDRHTGWTPACSTTLYG